MDPLHSAGHPGLTVSAGAVDRWGDLPTHARDVFQSQGGAALPARYRDWIDQYYRKLNARR